MELIRERARQYHHQKFTIPEVRERKRQYAIEYRRKKKELFNQPASQNDKANSDSEVSTSATEN